jgi:hypothetical protein
VSHSSVFVTTAPGLCQRFDRRADGVIKAVLRHG